MFIRRVAGQSMSPALKSGQIVIGWRTLPRVGGIVLAHQAGREVIKRIESVKNNEYYLVGDNRAESQDSRHYGSVTFHDIIGSIMIQLPHAVDPPKLVKPYGAWAGRVAAAILALMALIHLFRIDTLIPIIDAAIPGGGGWATLVTVIIIISEVFAAPFALRMKLSLLAQFKSATLMVLAPFLWFLMGIWAYGTGLSTGLFGQFIETPSNIVFMLVILVWLAFNYWALWLLGYNHLPLKKLLKK